MQYRHIHYTLRGPKKNLKAIDKELKEMENDPKIKRNIYGHIRMDELEERLGFDFKEFKSHGGILEYYFTETGDYIITYEAMFHEQEGVRVAIKRRFPRVKVFFKGEIFGHGVYKTNDVKRECYVEDYRLEVCDGKTYQCRYYDSMEEVVKQIREFGYKGDCSIQEVKKFVNEYNKPHFEEDDGVFIYFAELERYEDAVRTI